MPRPPGSGRKPGITLTARQRRVVQEFLIDGNITQAGIRAGYSKRAARNSAWDALHKPHVAEYLKAEQAKLAAKFNVTTERLIEEYARIAFAEMGDFATWGPNGVKLKDSAELTEDQRRAVAEVWQTETGVRLKHHDKKGALDSLGKHLQMFVERKEITGEGGGPIVIVTGVKRATDK